VLEIWRQPGGNKVAGGTTLVAVLAGGARTQTVAANAGDEIYVLAMNTGKNARDVAVTVSDSTTTPPPPAKTYTITYRLENDPHPFTYICSDACGDLSTATTGVTGTLATASGKATLTSSYTTTDELGDTVTCQVSATGTWDATSLYLDLNGTFACAARTHKETGSFTSHSDWIDMGKGYLQPLSTPTWSATWTSAGVDTFICDGTCTGPVMFKPTRLTP
jgi:hypothetical protein